MTTRLMIARHGNTFAKGDTPTRVGRRTDLPLVASGFEQAKQLGLYLQAKQLLPDYVFSSDLQRTRQTAATALEVLGLELEIVVDDRFNEIDYGPDENKPESDVIARVGEQALSQWDQSAVVPDGWQVNPAEIIQSWKTFGDLCQQHFQGKNILVVTSNGIARFAPYLTGDFEGFKQSHTIKIATGALCILECCDKRWSISAWNIKPKDKEVKC